MKNLNKTIQKNELEDLENAKIAARNVYEDLKIEKERIAQTKAKDEAMLASIGNGVIATDQEGRVIQINRETKKLLQRKKTYFIGKRLCDLLYMYDNQGVQVPCGKQPIQIALSTGKATTNNESYFYKKKNGTKFPVAITITPVILNKKIIGAIEIFRDITKEKEIEKTRTDFLALASHQLRTPLSGTKWLIETMQREILGKMTPKQKEYLKQIYNSNERMIRLVGDMLNVLRLESNVVEVQKEMTSISKLADELMLMMEPAAKNKGIIIKNILKDYKNVIIKTNTQILKNLLECLISNAINYSSSGQQVILDMKEKNSEIIFLVKDSGIGIPQKEQKKIFERFYRASNAKMLKPNGTGLGLYIASMLAEKINGKISFESKEGKGSTFYLRISKRSKKNHKTEE